MSASDSVRIPMACIICKSKTSGLLVFGYLTTDRSIPSLTCDGCGTRYIVEVAIAT